MKTKKTRVVQNLGNDHQFVEGLDAKKKDAISTKFAEGTVKTSNFWAW